MRAQNKTVSIQGDFEIKSCRIKIIIKIIGSLVVMAEIRQLRKREKELAKLS